MDLSRIIVKLNRIRWASVFYITMLLSIAASAQVTFRIIQLPASTPANAEIYISGNFEGWTGGQAAYRLEVGPDSLFFITLPQMTGTIQFKFTRGSWDSVEKGINGEEIANRTYTFGGNGATVNMTIQNWASGNGSTAANNVHLLDNGFFMPQLNRSRRIWIYLPPDYETSQESYPVMYMHDGQNLFDNVTAFAGEWEVDETLNALHEETGFGMIVVGIDNGGSLRIDEYSPWINPQYGGGDGELYIDFLTETLKPFIDSMYRTLSDPGNTALMGSSMGGLISHYGGIAEPPVFGRIGVFSPSFGVFDSCYVYTSMQSIDTDSKFYFLGGGQESGVVARITEMVATMTDVGATPDQMHIQVDPLGMHNEAFWRKEFGDAVEWLFADSTMVGTSEGLMTAYADINIYPNPVSTLLNVVPEDLKSPYILQVFDALGRRLLSVGFTGVYQLGVATLPSGFYILRISSGDRYRFVRLAVE